MIPDDLRLACIPADAGAGAVTVSRSLILNLPHPNFLLPPQLHAEQIFQDGKRKRTEKESSYVPSLASNSCSHYQFLTESPRSSWWHKISGAGGGDVDNVNYFRRVRWFEKGYAQLMCAKEDSKDVL